MQGEAVLRVIGVGNASSEECMGQAGTDAQQGLTGAPNSPCGFVPQMWPNLDTAQSSHSAALSRCYRCAGAIKAARRTRSVASTTVDVSVWCPGRVWIEVRNPPAAILAFAPETPPGKQVPRRELRTG